MRHTDIKNCTDIRKYIGDSESWRSAYFATIQNFSRKLRSECPFCIVRTNRRQTGCQGCPIDKACDIFVGLTKSSHGCFNREWALKYLKEHKDEIINFKKVNKA